MHEPNWDAFIAIMIPNLVGFACAIPLKGQISNKDGTAWYQTLKKPTWILPDWSYGPVFVFMFSGLGYASYLVYLDSSGFIDNSELFPLGLYAAHLLITLTGCVTFYKFHKIGYTMLQIFSLDFILLGLSVGFYQINQYTAFFLLPAQVFTLYNSLLIHALWVLNGKVVDDRVCLKA